MELIDNINKTLKGDFVTELRSGSKVAIAASCFSIYAFEELKAQLKDIDELRFIFTSPTFVTEKANKQKREFYIPRLNRERNLYGSEFEIKLRNELSQDHRYDYRPWSSPYRKSVDYTYLTVLTLLSWK